MADGNAARVAILDTLSVFKVADLKKDDRKQTLLTCVFDPTKKGSPGAFIVYISKCWLKSLLQKSKIKRFLIELNLSQFLIPEILRWGHTGRF